MKRRKNKYHSIESKLKLILEYESGNDSLKSLAIRYEISYSLVKQWISHYRANGVSGLSLKNQPYTSYFRKEIVLQIFQNQLSLNQASIKYQISISVLYKWVKTVQKSGIEALDNIKQGRPNQGRMKKPNNKKIKVLTKQEELLLENERLRAENAFLKKLQTLMQEQDAQKKEYMRKSFKH